MNKIDLSNVPQKPGCYLWRDEFENVIYVGKSKNLKSRMKQYFNTNLNPKTKLLVQKIRSFDYVVVENELDALLTELNLIKKYNPKFNIKLKESKTYPYLKITKSPLKLELKINVKKIKNNLNQKYFGPFPEGFGPGKIKKLMETIYPISKCYKPNNKEKTPCLNYQLGICLGYCFKDKEFLKAQEEIYFKKIKNFLKGETKEVLDFTKSKIEFYSEKQKFEESNKLFNLIPTINHYGEKQNSFFNDTKNRDFVSFFGEDGTISIAFSFIRYGKLISMRKFLFDFHEFTENEALIFFLEKFYFENLIPDELVIDIETNNNLSSLIKKITIPQKGIKSKILKNTFEESKNHYFSNIKIFNLKKEQLKESLKNLEETFNKKINLIEIIDVSNFFGEDQVGGVVAFENGVFQKDLYRKYNLANGINDYLMIKEVAYRHFRKKLLNKQTMPDLFLVDGKHQTNYVIEVLKELKINNVLVAGLVKDEAHKTNKIFFENKTIYIKDKNLFLLLYKLQEEIHGFVIRHHRNKKRKNTLI